MRWMLLMLCCWAGTASAGPTMQIWKVESGVLSNVGNPISPFVPFEIMITVKTDGHDMSGLDFGFVGFEVTYPAMLVLGRNYAGPATIDLGDTAAGLFKVRLDGCAAPCELREVMRVEYVELGTALSGQADVIVTLSGPSEASTEPVLYDCQNAAYPAPMGGAIRPRSASGAVAPPGGMLINPTPGCVIGTPIGCSGELAPLPACNEVVSVSAQTFSLMKSRFVD